MGNDPHVAGWGSDAPVPAQLKEFFAQIESGKITKRKLQQLLNQKDTSKYLTVEVGGINREQSDADAVRATGRNILGNIDHAQHLPSGEGASEEITFIPITKTMSPDKVDELVTNAGKYASGKGLCKHNQDKPDFAEKTPHFTQGKDGEGRHCYAAFNGWNGRQDVFMLRNEDDWGVNWSVAVVLASPEGLET